MRTIIHVHQQVVATNRKHGTNEPPLTVKTFASDAWNAKPVSLRRAHEAVVSGPCRIVHSPHRPLPCGARVWIETESEVTCDEESRPMEAEPRQICNQVCKTSDRPTEESDRLP